MPAKYIATTDEVRRPLRRVCEPSNWPAALDDPRHEAIARYYTSNALRSIGDIEGTRRHSTAFLDVAERLRDRNLLAAALFANINLCQAAGDWDAARDYIDRGLALLPTETRLLNARTLLEYETGDLVQGGAYLDRFLEAVRLNPPGPTVPYAMMAGMIPRVAQISGEMDRFDIAEEAADAVLSSPSPTANVVEIARTGLARMSIQRGDVSSAAAQYKALESGRGILGLSYAMDRLLGLLSQTIGKLEQAVDHFEVALDLCQKMGYRPELAWTCCDYADCLLQRAASGDRAKAQSLLEKSLSIATELGMKPLMARVTERLEQVQTQPYAAPAYPDGLTEREVEVLRLIAAGKTNLEIAEELVIAEGTARRHVANIYEKIGAANRVEAAAYANQHGLLESS